MEAQRPRPWGECRGGSPGPPLPGGSGGRDGADPRPSDREATAPPGTEKKAAFVAKKSRQAARRGCRRGREENPAPGERGGQARRGAAAGGTEPYSASPARGTKPPRSPGAAVRPAARAPELGGGRGGGRAGGQCPPGVRRCPSGDGEALPGGGTSRALLVTGGGGACAAAARPPRREGRAARGREAGRARVGGRRRAAPSGPGEECSGGSAAPSARPGIR